MHTSEAAQIFHDWANGEGMIPDGPTSPIVSTPQDFVHITPKTEGGKQILRTKQIQAIASNEPLKRIVVFMRRAAPNTKKKLAMLPAHVDDVEIAYRQGSPVTIGPLLTLPQGGPSFTVRQTATGPAYTCGSSISVGNHRDAGTLTCLVRDAAGVLYGLSNNHISGSCSFALVGLPILAPGVFDVVPNGCNPFTIGVHSVSLPFVPGSPDNVDWKNNSDAAIFKITDPTKVSSYQGSAFDTPATDSPLIGNQVVEKVGRTTQHTTGRVLGQLHGAHPIMYNVAIYSFSGTVCFEPSFSIAGQGGLFSDSGDSGSLITTVGPNGVRTAVGIVVGAMNDGSAPGGKITVALPISPILQRLGVTLVSGHNI